tara:strand:+ start:1572 stop:2510 length:939 start_codon:yes stop_codon:yes gene_type:complete
MAWERLAHTELSATGDTVTTSTFTAKKNMKVIGFIKSTGNVNIGFQIGNATIDSGDNYAYRANNDGGTDATNTGTANFITNGSFSGTAYIELSITNISAEEKLIIGHILKQGSSGAGTAPNRVEVVSKWVNTSNQANIARFINNDTGDYLSGSYITVLGAKESATSDTLSVTDMTAKKHLMVQVHVKINTALPLPALRFNNDSGSNYARRESRDGGTEITSTSSTSIFLADVGGSEGDISATCFVINESSKEKLLIAESIRGLSSGSGTAPSRQETVAKWANTTNQITRVDLINGNTGNWAEGSEVTVYGTD